MTIIISLLFMVFVVVMGLRAPTPLEFIGRSLVAPPMDCCGHHPFLLSI